VKSCRLIVLGVFVLAVSGGFYYWNRPTARLRRQVDFWAHGHRWAAPGQSSAERDAARTTGLRALGDQAIDLLGDDVQQKDGLWDRIQEAVRSGLGPDWLRRRFQYQNRRPGFFYRCEAAESLGLLGKAARRATPALVHALSDRNINVRREAALALGRVGSNTPDVISALQTQTNHSYAALAAAAAFACWRLQPSNGLAVECVRRLVTNDYDCAIWVAPMIADAGPQAKIFVPSLEAALANQNDSAAGNPFYGQIQIRLARALWMIDRSPRAALEVFSSFTNAQVRGRLPPQCNPNFDLGRMTVELSDIPEYCLAARPVLKSIELVKSPDWPGPLLSNALQRVERTLAAEGMLTPHPAP